MLPSPGGPGTGVPLRGTSWPSRALPAAQLAPFSALSAAMVPDVWGSLWGVAGKTKQSGRTSWARVAEVSGSERVKLDALAAPVSICY